ncbi:MAG: alpha-D-ribose 1-methylphosphonate 5-triphosphate diphosphatase [Chloroflexota bacterium]
MLSVAIINGTVVLPNRVLARAGVIVNGATIVDVTDDDSAVEQADAVIDAQGSFVLPGIVDLHNDGLEIEVNPRPRAGLPLEFALGTFDRNLSAAGITTEFHAVAFMERQEMGRTGLEAERRAEFIRTLQPSAWAVDHHLLHRIDIWSPTHVDSALSSAAASPVGYVSLNDHTPGQGQFRDLPRYLERMRSYTAVRGTPEVDTDGVHRLIADRAEQRAVADGVYARVAARRRSDEFVLASHDDDSAEKVDAMWELGARVAEFPVTEEAARRARDRGMPIVVGAPNIMRGGSQSGNTSGIELFASGLADIICADYHAASILPAAFRLVDQGVTDLPTAIRSVSLAPARAVGMMDRGALEAGQRADLLIVSAPSLAAPRVELTMRGGQIVYEFMHGGRLAGVSAERAAAIA